MAGKHELEKFEYLFVDIEWNQTPGTNGIEDREPIQIGVVATDESMNLKKSFSRAMRLSSEEKYNPDTLVLSHSTLKSVMQANSEEIVLQKIKMSFPKYKYVVVWTKDTYELFKRGMDTYGYSMPRHRVIVFQEVLMHIASDGVNQIGFERALKQAGIEFQKNFLHYSKHDANYMYQLFCKCYKEYTRWTNQEVCYLSPRTHIIHTGSCRYSNKNHLLATNQAAKHVIFQGNRVCKICGCEDEWNRLQWGVSSGVKQNNRAEYLRELPLTDENMSMICNKFRLDYNIASDMVFIRTSFSGWIVHIQNDRVTKLRHENYRQRRDEALKIHKKCFEGYHKQKLPSSRFYDVVDPFIWALNSYYIDETSLLFNNSTFNNTSYLKEYLDLFKMEQKEETIYNYCYKIYGIESHELVDELIMHGKEAIDSPEKVIAYMNRAYRFWCQKLVYIKKRMECNIDILTDNEQTIILQSVEDVENELNKWFET